MYNESNNESESGKESKMKRWEHQQQSYDFSLPRQRVFDASDPGTGKTRVHLEVWHHRRTQGHGGALLVLAPKSLLESAWAEDIRKFLPVGTTYVIARAQNREKMFDERADIYITNTDAAKWLAAKDAKWFESTFGERPTLLVDEITSFKHRTSARSKALRKIAPFFTFRTGLTGTPNSNTILDLWHQMLIIDDGELLGQSFARFRNAACDYQRNPFGGKWLDKSGIEEVVAERISPLCIRHQFDECMDIPDNHMYTVEFDMPVGLRRHYENMVREAILILEEGDVTAINQGVMRGKLLQIASGAVYGDDDKGRRRDPTYKLLDRGRYLLIADLVEARDHSVVFFNWKHQREELKIEFESRGITYAVLDGNTPDTQREEIVRDYQAGKYQVVAMHPQTGAHGLTLTRGTRTIIGSPFDEADLLKQAIHRIYRGGQQYKTETILVQARGCRVEQRVYDNQSGKLNRMETLLDILKGEST